jgi:hypothetical protein
VARLIAGSVRRFSLNSVIPPGECINAQSFQLCDFLGNSANAIRWQVWTALLLYVLMRFLYVISSWNHSFTRLFTLLRAALWRKIDLWDLLRFCGTAGGHFRYLATPQNAYLPGFAQ